MDIAQKHNFVPVVHGDEIWNEFGVHFDDAAASFGTRHRFCEFGRKEIVDRDTKRYVKLENTVSLTFGSLDLIYFWTMTKVETQKPLCFHQSGEISPKRIMMELIQGYQSQLKNSIKLL